MDDLKVWNLNEKSAKMRDKHKTLFHQSKLEFWQIRYILTKDVAFGKTGKTAVLPEFCGIEPGGGSAVQRAAELPVIWLLF